MDKVNSANKNLSSNPCKRGNRDVKQMMMMMKGEGKGSTFCFCFLFFYIFHGGGKGSIICYQTCLFSLVEETEKSLKKKIIIKQNKKMKMRRKKNDRQTIHSQMQDNKRNMSWVKHQSNHLEKAHLGVRNG